MTAISFKSESSDDYLELFEENENIEQFILRMRNEHSDEWAFFNIVSVKTTDFNKSLLIHLIEKDIAEFQEEISY